MRLFVAFVVCVALLAVGRVWISFAVVEKTLQTDAIVREERRLSAENARLSEDLAELGSSVRIQRIASDKLGLQYPAHLEYLKARKGAGAGLTRVAAKP